MYRVLNVLARLLLRSPIHRILSSNTIVIGFSGVVTGRRYAVPVSYIQDCTTIRCFTAARWSRNLRGGVPVLLRLRGQNVAGTADVIVDDTAAVASGLAELLHRVPRDARLYKVHLNAEGTPDEADVQRVAQRNVMIQITLSTSR